MNLIESPDDVSSLPDVFAHLVGNVVTEEEAKVEECVELFFSEGSGRGLRAVKSFLRGDLIFRESPLMVGPTPPSVTSAICCCSCFKMLDLLTLSAQCKRCGIPACSETCLDSSGMRQHDLSGECDIIINATE